MDSQPRERPRAMPRWAEPRLGQRPRRHRRAALEHRGRQKTRGKYYGNGAHIVPNGLVPIIFAKFHKKL